MVISYVIIVALIAYILGAITKLFIDAIPNKFIPIQNVIIGLISAFICFYYKIETDLLTAIVLCVSSASASGGLYDLVQGIKKGNGQNGTK